MAYVGSGIANLTSALLLAEHAEVNGNILTIDIFESTSTIGGKMNYTRPIRTYKEGEAPSFFEAGPMRLPAQHGSILAMLRYINHLLGRKVAELMPFRYLNPDLQTPSELQEDSTIYNICEAFIVKQTKQILHLLEEDPFNKLDDLYDVLALDYYTKEAENVLPPEAIAYMKENGIRPFNDFMKKNSLLSFMIEAVIFITEKSQKEPWSRIRCGMGHLSRLLTLALLRQRKNPFIHISFHLETPVLELKEDDVQVSILTADKSLEGYDLAISGVNPRVYRDAMIQGRPFINLESSPAWKKYYRYLTHSSSYVLSRAVLVFRRPLLDSVVHYQGGYYYTGGSSLEKFSTFIVPSVEQEYTILYLYGGAKDGLTYWNSYQEGQTKQVTEEALQTISRYLKVSLDDLKTHLVSHEYVNWGQEPVDSATMGHAGNLRASRYVNEIAKSHLSRILATGEMLQPFGGWSISAMVSAHQTTAYALEQLHPKQIVTQPLFSKTQTPDENLKLFDALMAEEYQENPQKNSLFTYSPLTYNQGSYDLKISWNPQFENILTTQEVSILKKLLDIFTQQHQTGSLSKKITDHIYAQTSFFVESLTQLSPQERKIATQALSKSIKPNQTLRDTLFPHGGEWISYLLLLDNASLSYSHIALALTASYGSSSYYNPLKEHYEFKDNFSPSPSSKISQINLAVSQYA